MLLDSILQCLQVSLINCCSFVQYYIQLMYSYVLVQFIFIVDFIIVYSVLKCCFTPLPYDA